MIERKYTKIPLDSLEESALVAGTGNDAGEVPC
jgi:hypothetical protein